MPKVVPEYKDIARTKIVDAAREVFLEKGFRQTAMEEISDKLGISKAALYTYFKDKEDLFRAAYESSPASLKEILSQSSGVREPRKFFDSLFDKLRPSAKSSALGFEVLSEATRNPELRKVLRANYDQYLAAVEQCLRGSLFGKQYKMQEVAMALVGLWNGMETMIAVGYSVSEVKDSWNEALRIFFRS